MTAKSALEWVRRLKPTQKGVVQPDQEEMQMPLVPRSADLEKWFQCVRDTFELGDDIEDGQVMTEIAGILDSKFDTVMEFLDFKAYLTTVTTVTTVAKSGIVVASWAAS